MIIKEVFIWTIQIDQRGVLDNEIFSYRISKDEKVFISIVAFYDNKCLKSNVTPLDMPFDSGKAFFAHVVFHSASISGCRFFAHT